MGNLAPRCRLEVLYNIAKEHGMFEGKSEKEAYEIFEKEVLTPEIIREYCKACGDIECSRKDSLKI